MISRWRVTLGFVVAIGSVATAQQKDAGSPTLCRLIQQDSTRITTDSVQGVGQMAFVGGGALMKCPSRSITLKGDSAVRYPDHYQMIGHAVYDEPRFHVTATYLNYFPLEDVVRAVADVHAKLPNGSTLDGPQAEYRRPKLPARPHRQLYAPGRPTIKIVQPDSGVKKGDTTTVIANVVFMDGDSLIYAGGQVDIQRPDISAQGDSAFIDQTKETMRLMRKPQLMGKKERPFTLAGDLIDLFSKDRKLQRVISRGNAVAVSDSTTLKSDTIDLRIVDDLLNHAYVWGPSRARVISPGQNMTADSLSVSMPGQHIQLVHALRKAFAEGRPDTSRFRAQAPDTLNWMRGDTIIAHFDSVPAKDTSKNPAIKQLVASGHASALYHLAPSDSSQRTSALNYVTARAITLEFEKQKVTTVTTLDSVQGVYIEPRDTATKKPANKANTPPAKPGAPPPKKPGPPRVDPDLSAKRNHP